MVRVSYDKARPQKVDFFGNHQDLLCFAFASTGISTQGIQDALAAMGIHLTYSQIMYRIGRAEHGRRANEQTQRRLFREGKSPIAQAIVSQIVGNRGLGQTVKRNVVDHLNKKDLYQPRPDGVMDNGNSRY